MIPRTMVVEMESMIVMMTRTVLPRDQELLGELLTMILKMMLMKKREVVMMKTVTMLMTLSQSGHRSGSPAPLRRTDRTSSSLMETGPPSDQS